MKKAMKPIAAVVACVLLIAFAPEVFGATARKKAAEMPTEFERATACVERSWVQKRADRFAKPVDCSQFAGAKFSAFGFISDNENQRFDDPDVTWLYSDGKFTFEIHTDEVAIDDYPAYSPKAFSYYSMAVKEHHYTATTGLGRRVRVLSQFIKKRFMLLTEMPDFAFSQSILASGRDARDISVDATPKYFGEITRLKDGTIGFCKETSHDPTVDNPTDVREEDCYLSVTLKEIQIVQFLGGKIYADVKY